MKQYTFIGTTDEINQCGCCGRTDLKGTKVLKDNESGEFVFFGSVCGAKALGWSVKEFDAAAKKADKDRLQAKRDYENNHPLRIIWGNLLNELNSLGIRDYKQRLAHPLYIEAEKVYKEMNQDIQEKFGKF